MKRMLIILLGVLFVWFARVPITHYALQHDVEFTVTRSERVVDASGGTSRYLVWTDKGVYQNIDDMWFLKWNSSDVQGLMVPNAHIKAKITGLRMSIFSWYPNIVKASNIP